MTEFTARYLSDYTKPHFSIATTDLSFELSDEATIVTNVMSITRIGDAKASLVLDGEQLELVSISVNQQCVPKESYVLTDNSLELFTTENAFELTIVTQINPLKNTALEGLFKSGDAFCTQCEAEGFRRITYYIDRPDVMAIFSVAIVADKNTYPYLLANGNKIEQGDLPNGRHFVKWYDPFPKPCYLFALVAGDFDLLKDTYRTSSNKEVQLEIFVDKGNRAKAQHAMTSLKQSMKWDEDTFGLEYDLDIYMIVAVDFFNMGAMENKGLNVFNSKYVLADNQSATDTDYFNIQAVIAHEYFHNWTGNRVTCRDWFQLSLKEGLTVFRDQQFSADMHSAAVTRIQNVRVLRSQQFAEDAGPMAHPIRPEKVIEMNNFYTLTVYEKGAEVIRMIHTLLGPQKFRQGMDLYFARFDGMAVTCDDFVNAMADASGIDLSQFKRWYCQAGTPQLSVEQTFDKERGELKLCVEQSLKGPSTQQNKELHIPINIELIDVITKQSYRQLIELKDSQQTWTFNGYEHAPIVAFLGGFSAPVKVSFKQTDAELITIMEHAQDDFCRWDAGQKLFTRYIQKVMIEPDLTLPQVFISAFANILSSSIDPALIAEQLTLPSFDELADLIDEVDPISLLDAITNIKLQLALGLNAQLNDVYVALCQSANTDNAIAAAERSLKNVCLSYLALFGENENVVLKHFNHSNNMTDTLAAMQCSAKNNLSCFDEQMACFEEKWHDTSLVMDKWFMLNASLVSGQIYQHLESLLAHPAFSLKNPNRARSLIGAFVHNNPRYFHDISGKGYQFLSAQVAKLNEINPQVASRLITPLIQFKGFDHTRQQLMLAEIKKLSQMPKLSKDLQEKLDAALK
ncbi:aminopeptidase N [Colwelliaceae bacterium 6471]